MPDQIAERAPEVGFDVAFLEKWIRYQKYAWAFIGLSLLAGLGGLFGRGPLAKSRVSSGSDGLAVEYEKVARNKTPAVVEIRLPENASSQRILRIHLEGELMERGRYSRILPAPDKTMPLPTGVVLEYAASPALNGAKVVVTQEPGSPGLLHSAIWVEGGPGVKLDQLVLP